MSDFSFKLPAGCKIGDCAGENVKFQMGGILAMPSKPRDDGSFPDDWLIATDSKIAAFVPTRFDGERPQRPVLLPPISVANGKDSTVHVNGNCLIETPGPKGSVKQKFLPMPKQEGRFPPIKDVMPKRQDNFISVTIDANMLSDLANAISGNGSVTLHIRTRNTEICQDPILVVGHESDNGVVRGFGLMMPQTPQRDSKEMVFDALRHIPNEFGRLEEPTNS